jgi:uncharacterized protein YlxW (UPF0749 family)
MRRHAETNYFRPRGARLGNTFTLFAFVLLLLLGILTSSQIRAIAEERARLAETQRDYQYYVGLIDGEKAYMADLRQKLDDLSTHKESLLESALQGTGDQTALAQLKVARGVAGFSAVSGSGIRVTMDDTDLRTPDMDPTSSIIHDADIRQVVDLLRAAGATGISVNGQRIVSTSELICNGPTILINGLKYPVPYLVEAVGNPDLLLFSIENDEYLGYRRAEGVLITSERITELSIPAFDGTDRIDSLIDALEVNQS